MARTSGLKGAELAKALPNAPKEALFEALRGLAARGALFRYQKGKTERFFAADPVARLDALVPALLERAGPLDEASLKAAVEAEARGHGDLLREWLRGARARRVVFEHGPKPGARTKRIGREPDLGRHLAGTFSALRKALLELDAAGVPRERVAAAVRKELGLSPASAAAPAPPAGDRDAVLRALGALAAEHRPGALLLVRDLRARVGLDKDRFDLAVLALASERKAILHHHDHAAALSEKERRELVFDGRVHYVGIAPRSPS